MVRNNDDKSFVSWGQTFHPETAPESFGPHFQNNNGSPWAAVYNEARGNGLHQENIPVAHVVAIDNETDQISQISPPDVITTTNNNSNNTTATAYDDVTNRHMTTNNNDDATGDNVSTPLQPWRNSNLIDLIFGFFMTFAAVLTTFKIEFFAIVVYATAAGFYYLAEETFTNPCLILFKGIFLLVSSILMLVDAILLSVGVFLTELLAFIAMLLCTVFGGPRSGSEWHQYVRQLCHLTRWAFRGCHQGWKLERIFPIPADETNNPNESNNNNDCVENNIENDNDDDDDEMVQRSYPPYRDNELPENEHYPSNSVSNHAIISPSTRSISSIETENVHIAGDANHYIKNIQSVELT